MHSFPLVRNGDAIKVIGNRLPSQSTLFTGQSCTHQQPVNPQWASGTCVAMLFTLVPSFSLSHGMTACILTKCGANDHTITAGVPSHPSCRVACAPYSGPTAMIRDDRRLVTVRDAGGDMRPVLLTYSAAGTLLGTAVWEGYADATPPSLIPQTNAEQRRYCLAWVDPRTPAARRGCAGAGGCVQCPL